SGWQNTLLMEFLYAISRARSPRIGAATNEAFMKRTTSVLAIVSCLGVVSASSAARASVPNMTFAAAEIGHPIDLFQGANMPDGPGGIDTVFMAHNYLIVLGTKDSGKPPGAFHTFDISDPKNPKMVKSYTSP